MSNFTRILSDSFVALSLKNTLYFTAGSVGLGIVLALGLASAINGTSFETRWLKWVCFIPDLMGSAIHRLEANLSGILWTPQRTADGGEFPEYRLACRHKLCHAFRYHRQRLDNAGLQWPDPASWHTEHS